MYIVVSLYNVEHSCTSLYMFVTFFIKESKKYIGIDSWLSVIAGYKFDDLDIKIKCFNPHGLNNRDCYYPLVKTDNLFEPNFKGVLFRHPKDLQKLP